MSERNRFERLEDLFHRALSLEPDARSVFLERECGTDAELRAQVDRLLARERAGAHLDAGEPLRPPEQPGTRIGNYTLVRRIAEGGMGTVFEAAQERPVRRNVALKLVKWGMDTQQVVRRFESERQALARMSHPNIAGVHDAGATERGRPYFVMELVEGIPITDFCDQHALTLAERIRLLLRVCEGVQHAHQKGVIHRDIKPSNLLVGMQGGAPLPKIIDFGIAKATVGAGMEPGTLTQLGQLVGTPGYMSPEQTRSGNVDVDTRSDVYSLGVVLYELATGRLPFERGPGEGDAELLARIQQEDPARPGARVAALPREEREQVARGRATAAASLPRQLRGDLDWITLRALEKEPARRYASAAELADDLRRHLEHQPVRAGPPGAAYRVRKFVRRHRVGVAATTLVVAALVLGTAAAIAGLVQARRAEAQARAETEKTRLITDLMAELLQVSDPTRARTSWIPAREILDDGAERIVAGLEDQPEVRARLLGTIGRVYRNLGFYERSRAFLEQALALQETHLAPDDLAIAQTLVDLGWVLYQENEFERALAYADRIVEVHRRALPPDHPKLAWALTGVGATLVRVGQLDRAEPYVREGLAIFEEGPETSDWRAGAAWTHLARILERRGDLPGAVLAARRTLEIFERNLQEGGYWHPLQTTLPDVAEIELHAGNLEQARQLYERALDRQQGVLGPEHPEVGVTLHGLAVTLERMDRPAEALAAARRSLALRERVWATETVDVAESLQTVALAQLRLGQGEAALANARRAAAILTDRDGFPSPALLESERRLADALWEADARDEARTFYAITLRRARRHLAPGHPLLQRIEAERKSP